MEIKCPKCGDAGEVPDEMAGKRLKCVKCKTVFAVPEARPEDRGVSFSPVFTVKLSVDPSLGPTEVVVVGKKIDLSKSGPYVYITGLRDNHTSPNCIPFLGMKFQRNDPRLSRGRGRGNLHAGNRNDGRRFFVCRCLVTYPELLDERHEELIRTPGLEYVRQLIRENRTDLIDNLYGKTRMEYLMRQEIQVEELYTEDWKLVALSQLIETVNRRRDGQTGLTEIHRELNHSESTS